MPSSDEGLEVKTNNGDVVRFGLCGNMRKLFSISRQSKPGLDSVLKLQQTTTVWKPKAVVELAPHGQGLGAESAKQLVIKQASCVLLNMLNCRSLTRPKHEFFAP